MSDYKDDVPKILAAVGGTENVSDAAHCVTRLRLVLKDDKKVSQEALDAIETVKGHFAANGQFQIVIGPGLVDKVYDEFIRAAGISEGTQETFKEAANEKINPFSRLIKTLGDIFIPILPAIVAAGLLLGLNNLLSNPGIFYPNAALLVKQPQWAGLAGIINLLANTAFQFLPALVAWSAVKKFGGNQVMGIVLGLVMVNPLLMTPAAYAHTPKLLLYWNLFGWKIPQLGYSGQVIPTLVAAFLLAKIEIWLAKHVPDIIKMIVVYPVSLLVTGFLTLTLIGPFTTWLSNMVTDGILDLFKFSPVVAGFIFGALVSPIVITGLHYVILGVNLQMIGTLGYCTLWPIQVMASLGQGAAALMMFFLMKNKKDKSTALSASITAWLGVTEPAMYGINLRYRYPFVASMIGAGVSGAIIAAAGANKATSIGISGLPAPLSIEPKYWPVYITAMLISIALTMALTFIFSSNALRSRLLFWKKEA